MGAGQSSMGAKGYSVRAQSSKRLADDILTLMFKKTDFKDLLNLTNLQACSRYVFTTASALSSLFHSMKVYPKVGEDSTILFAPVSELAPGLIRNSVIESPADYSKKIEERNRLCIEIAYFYIRVFQIYGALALTVMDADPVRARQFTAAATAPSAAFGMKGVAGPRAAPFQKGGSVLASTSQSPIVREIKELFKKSPLKYFDEFCTAYTDGVKKQVIVQGKEKNRSIVISLTETLDENLHRLEGYYQVANRDVKDVSIEVRIEGDLVIFYVNNQILIQVDKRNVVTQGSIKRYTIVPLPDDKLSRNNPLDYLNYRMKELFPDDEVSSAAAAPSYIAAAPRPSSGVISVPAGKSVFEGFEDLKKIFAAKTSTVGFVFPKAYCVARAMTLLNPIFPEELPKGSPTGPQPVIESQVCSSTFDFEVGGDPYMPRPGKTPSANLYYKSLVALFYDTYKIGGGTIEFTQSESGRSLLRQASTNIAKLNYIKDPAQQAAFLTSQQRFTDYQVCSSGDKSKPAPRFLIIKPELRKKLFDEVISEMLKFQEMHTANVNTLLKKIFVIKGDKLILNNSLLSGGRVALNALGYEAHQLLLKYYMYSEGYYIRGIRTILHNQALWKPFA
jgi:hypothetical protein